MTDIGFGTSALSNILKKTLPIKIKQANNRYIISHTSFYEITNTPDHIYNNIKNNLAEFLMLKNIYISRYLKRIIEEEVSKPITSQPTISRQSKEKIAIAIKSDCLTEDNYSRTLSDVKDDLLNSDSELVEEYAKTINIHETIECLKNYNGIHKNNMWFEIIIKAHSLSKYKTSQIIKSQTKEFKAIKNWSIFSEFYALELMLNPELKGKINDWNTVGTKRDRGTHHDHLILGELAYCEIIVSDDKNLKRRWDKLYAKRLIPFTMISSSELLDSFNYE